MENLSQMCYFFIFFEFLTYFFFLQINLLRLRDPRCVSARSPFCLRLCRPRPSLMTTDALWTTRSSWPRLTTFPRSRVLLLFFATSAKKVRFFQTFKPSQKFVVHNNTKTKKKKKKQKTKQYFPQIQGKLEEEKGKSAITMKKKSCFFW